eukprot:5038693-Pyramimonas_sp.AAC.1
MRTAAEERNVAALRALRRQYSGAGQGPQQTWKHTDGDQGWTKEGAKGGLKANAIDYEQAEREHCRGVDNDGDGHTRYVDAELMEDAREDRQALVR